jgi:hypothetical protein
VLGYFQAGRIIRAATALRPEGVREVFAALAHDAIGVFGERCDIGERTL